MATGAPRESPALRARYRRILRFAGRACLQTWWYEFVLPRVGLTALATRSRERRLRAIAERFHHLAVELGGLMIKVGQFMSARLDVLPPEVTRELAGLQDEVPAVPFDEIRVLAEAELGMPLGRAFEWFDETPLAAASLGQAHRARLDPLSASDAGFAEVVVKVQRPGIENVVEVDLRALRRVAGWLSRVPFIADRVDVPALVAEFGATSRDELDYLHEAVGAERFAAMFVENPRVTAPEVAWERTTRRVLTLADVTAIKISDVAALERAGIDPREVANVFATAMFDQVFTHGYFHADPHPGNVFVTPGERGRPWQVTFVDFGMMGEVPEGMREGLRTLLVGVASRDSRMLVEAAQQIGVLLPTASTSRLEHGLTKLFARFGGMGFNELRRVDPRELQRFAVEAGQVLRSLPLQLPEHLLLLIRAVSLSSGMCTALSPSFNAWEAVEPYASQLLREERGNLAADLTRQTVSNVGTLWRLPGRIDDLITRVNEGAVTFDTSRLERRIDRLDGLVRRAVSGVLFAGLLIGGGVVLPTNGPLGTVLICVSALPLLHALFAGIGRGRG